MRNLSLYEVLTKIEKTINSCTTLSQLDNVHDWVFNIMNGKLVRVKKGEPRWIYRRGEVSGMWDVFSSLIQKKKLELEGKSDTLLSGEYGVNDKINTYSSIEEHCKREF